LTGDPSTVKLAVEYGCGTLRNAIDTQDKGRSKPMQHIIMVLMTAILLVTSFSCGYKEREAAQQSQVEAQQAELERQRREIQKLKQAPQF
jgi:cell division protein FtsB